MCSLDMWISTLILWWFFFLVEDHFAKALGDTWLKIKAAKAKLLTHKKRSREIGAWIHTMSETIPRSVEEMKRAHQKSMHRLHQENRVLQRRLNGVWSVVRPNNARNLEPTNWLEEKELIVEILQAIPSPRDSHKVRTENLGSRLHQVSVKYPVQSWLFGATIIIGCSGALTHKIVLLAGIYYHTVDSHPHWWHMQQTFWYRLLCRSGYRDFLDTECYADQVIATPSHSFFFHCRCWLKDKSRPESDSALPPNPNPTKWSGRSTIRSTYTI